MKYNPARNNRRSIRLRGYDYANVGAYFVTICLNQRIPKMQTQPEFDFPTFGLVKNGVMILNDSGKMVQNDMPKYYPDIEVNEFIVMPDHIHGIIKINNPSITNNVVGATQRGCPYSAVAVSLPYLIDRFKTGTTNKYIDGVKTSKWKPFHKKLWQRNYYESIIRNETEYARITKYIRNNPILWGFSFF